MDYVNPNEVVSSIAFAGKNKTQLSVGNILLKAGLAGAFLGFATTLAFTGSNQTGLDIVGAIIFPTGFVMILLLNLELVTGSFAIIPIAKFRGETTTKLIFRNLSWSYIGNFIGSLFYAVLYSISISKFGHDTESLMIDKIIAVAEAKTLG